MSRYPAKIRKRLNVLSDKARLLFGALTCEHLYPNYVAFQQKAEWGDAHILYLAIEAIHLRLSDDISSSPAQIVGLMDCVELIMPDINQCPDSTSQRAKDACIITLSSLEYMITNDIESIVAVATYARDAFKTSEQIQDGARSKNGNNQRPNTTKSTSIIREIRRQIHLIQELSKPDNQQITAALIDSLRRK
ncbi:DUF416 family protein [Dyadobacter jiangsuensis]|uniref:Uncharacterized protein YjaG (DUF416 family) n=1 Tax=Dyadobacter jiangsuensis TaxID=1591085 RepID=A0A2P8F935_9BACT|nr:DUF416 family protein [Dyadobacter jiangsuensis]PSL18237.1 uncharacterized protein YjaG (DUF416 family) [Dyadobacter jiangsuensis]